MAEPPALPTLEQPPIRMTEDGSVRRVGVEVEFAGIDLAAAAAAVQRQFGGQVEVEDAHRLAVRNTRFGDFEVELDSEYAHPSDWDPKTGSLVARAGAVARAAVGDIIEHWMPREVVSPPLPLDDLPEMDCLCWELRSLGAVGTSARWHYAFAVQLNPEVPSLACRSVLGIFRAFLLLSDWLHSVAGRDAFRDLLAFAQPFPRSYIRSVLAPDYDPDWPRFIDDYLTANPTRNRDLDLCPLFAHVDEPRLRAHLNDTKVKARPTFHYRLPDSRIDDRSWSIVGEWNRWVLVERLANDPATLMERRQRFLAHFIDSPPSAWSEDTARWLGR